MNEGNGLPARPDEGTSSGKGKRIAAWVAAIVLVVLIVSVVSAPESDAPGEATPAPAPTSAAAPTEPGITPELIVALMPRQKVVQFCTIVDTLGEGPAYDAFAKGYGDTQDPNAREVFDYVIAEEC